MKDGDFQFANCYQMGRGVGHSGRKLTPFGTLWDPLGPWGTCVFYRLNERGMEIINPLGIDDDDDDDDDDADRQTS